MQSRATKQELQQIWPMTAEVFPFSDLFYVSILSLFLMLTLLAHSHTSISLGLSHKHYGHRCNIHTYYGNVYNDAHTRMGDPTEVMVDLWLFDLLCYFNVCCCSKPHLTTWQRGPITIPLGVCVCVCHTERGQHGGAWKKAVIETERLSACACMWYKHDRLISHQWPFKVFSIGTPDLFTWCQ